MHASAQLPAALAEGEEKERIHTSGPHEGTFFVSGLYLPERKDTEDFTTIYMETLQRFLEDQPRVAQGHAYNVTIIA